MRRPHPNFKLKFLIFRASQSIQKVEQIYGVCGPKIACRRESERRAIERSSVIVCAFSLCYTEMSSISTAADQQPALNLFSHGVSLVSLQSIVPRLIDNGYAADIAVLIDVHPFFRSDPELLRRAISDSAARLESISPATLRDRPGGRRDLFSDFIYWNHLAADVLGHDDKVELFLANGANEIFDCSFCHTESTLKCVKCSERCCKRYSSLHEEFVQCASGCCASICEGCLYFSSELDNINNWHFCPDYGGNFCPSCLESKVEWGDAVMCRDCRSVECQHCRMNTQPYFSCLSDYAEWQRHRHDKADTEAVYYCGDCLTKRLQRRQRARQRRAAHDEDDDDDDDDISDYDDDNSAQDSGAAAAEARPPSAPFRAAGQGVVSDGGAVVDGGALPPALPFSEPGVAAGAAPRSGAVLLTATTRGAALTDAEGLAAAPAVTEAAQDPDAAERDFLHRMAARIGCDYAVCKAIREWALAHPC